LTLWVANLMGAGLDDDSIDARRTRLPQLGAGAMCELCRQWRSRRRRRASDPVARRFRDRLGWTNQIVGRAADNVLLMVAGYPIRVK